MHSLDQDPVERRRSLRLRLRAAAALTVDGRRIAAWLEDASQGGALLHLEEAVEPGAGRYSVSIAFGRDPEEAVSAPISVVDVVHRSMRFQWQEPLPPEDWIKLRQLMEREHGTLTIVQGRLPMLVWPSLASRGR
jgi:hypothetical protein